MEGLQARAEIDARCSLVTRHQSEIESSIRRKIVNASSENLALIHKTEFSIRTAERGITECAIADAQKRRAPPSLLLGRIHPIRRMGKSGRQTVEFNSPSGS